MAHTATWGPSCICGLRHSSWQCQILNPLSEARAWTRVLMDTNWFCYCWAMMGIPTQAYFNSSLLVIMLFSLTGATKTFPIWLFPYSILYHNCLHVRNCLNVLGNEYIFVLINSFQNYALRTFCNTHYDARCLDMQPHGDTKHLIANTCWLNV